MSAEVKALATSFPPAVPNEDVTFLVEVLLTKGKAFDRMKAAKAAYDVAGYVLGRFFGTVATVESVAKPKKVSKKQLAEALQALGTSTQGDVTAKAFPAWLVPVLLDLAKTWLESRTK